MTDYPRISIRISPELDDLLTLHANREGVSRSRIIKTALQRHLTESQTNTGETA